MSRRIKRFLSVIACVFLAACCFLCGCHTPKDEITVYMPDGAPSLALAKMMADDTDGDGVTYKVVAPAVIKSKVTAKEADKNADICVLPALAASALLGRGDVYQMLGVVTHGNLYLIAKNKETYTPENLHKLLGKTVGVLQIADVPGLTFKSILKQNGVAYQETSTVEDKAADKVNLFGITGAADVGALQGVDVYLIAEPAVSAKVNANIGFSIVGDVQALYGGENGYPQAVMVAKKSLIASNGAFIKTFMQSVNDAALWLNVASGEEIVAALQGHLEDKAYVSTLKANVLKAETLARCGVRFMVATDCKQAFAAYLTRIAQVNAGKVGLVNDAFYCPLTMGGGV